MFYRLCLKVSVEELSQVILHSTIYSFMMDSALSQATVTLNKISVLGLTCDRLMILILSDLKVQQAVLPQDLQQITLLEQLKVFKVNFYTKPRRFKVTVDNRNIMPNYVE